MTGSIRGKVASRDIIYSPDVEATILRAFSDASSNVETARRSASTYTYIVTYALRQTAFRSSRGIFYSAEHIFAAEHVSAVQKHRSRMHILRVFIPRKLAKRILAASQMGEDTRSVSFLFPRNWFLNIFRMRRTRKTVA